MVVMGQAALPWTWGWQQQHAGHNYATMGNSTSVQYGSWGAVSAPMSGAAVAPQSMVAPQYNMTQMSAVGHQCPTQSHFTYTQYDASTTNINMSFRPPEKQERPFMPVTVSEHDVPRASSYPQESPSAQNDRHLSPSSRGETKMSNLKISHPLHTSKIKFNQLTSADPVNFTTAIDTLMKAIQKRPDSEDIVKGVPEIEQVKSEPTLTPKPGAGPIVPAPAPAPATMATESTDPPKPKRYICDVDGCGKSFYQITHLDTHRRAHTGEKPYQCNWPRCGRTFSQPGNLKKPSLKSIGEKPFRCEQCSKAFAQRGNLQTHMTTHSNAKPFVCKLDDCNKMFTQRGNLKNHQNKYHEKTLMEMTDWIVSISDIDALSNEEREMYWYFANLYKNSNKGIKGRGKNRRVSNRGAQPRTALSSYPVKRVPGSTSLDAYSSKRLPPPEQYLQQQNKQQHGYNADIGRFSRISSPIYDGLPGHTDTSSQRVRCNNGRGLTNGRGILGLQ